MTLSARVSREQPFLGEYQRSVERGMAQPKDLLGWFMREWRLEMPDSIHTRGIWRDRKRRDDAEAYQPVGGSLLGAPRESVSFQVFVEDSPFATEVAEYEGHRDTSTHYIHPMRAAIASLAGRGPIHDPYPFMARALYRTALMDGDWDAACRSLGIIEPVRKPYIQYALSKLWARYRIEPPNRVLREERVA